MLLNGGTQQLTCSFPKTIALNGIDYTVELEELVIQSFTNILSYAHYSELTQKVRTLVCQAMK